MEAKKESYMYEWGNGSSLMFHHELTPKIKHDHKRSSPGAMVSKCDLVINFQCH